MIRRLLLALVFCLFTLPAYAATCFWVGGTQTYDLVSNTASWASGTGGTPGTCAATGGIPKNAGDIATFDASSGGGTVRANVNGLSIAQINVATFTGTFDMATDNPTITLTTAFNLAGSGVRTVNCGTSTINLTSTAGSVTVLAITTTNLTISCASATWNVTGTTFNAQRIINGAAANNLGTLNISGGNNQLGGAGNAVLFSTVTVSPPAIIAISNTSTVTISNAFNFAGTAFNNSIVIQSAAFSGAKATISVASGAPTINWGVVANMTFSGGATFTCTNCIDGNQNSGITITGPSGGAASGRIIGGWLLKRDLRHDNDNSPAFVANAA